MVRFFMYQTLSTFFFLCVCVFLCSKVEKILKGSLDSIPSPSRSCEHLNFLFSLFWPNIAGHCQQTLLNKKFVDNAQQCFAFTPQANFPAHNLNFHWRWRWWVWIQAIFQSLFYSTTVFCLQLPIKYIYLLTLSILSNCSCQIESKWKANKKVTESI